MNEFFFSEPKTVFRLFDDFSSYMRSNAKKLFKIYAADPVYGGNSEERAVIYFLAARRNRLVISRNLCVCFMTHDMRLQ